MTKLQLGMQRCVWHGGLLSAQAFFYSDAYRISGINALETIMKQPLNAIFAIALIGTSFATRAQASADADTAEVSRSRATVLFEHQIARPASATPANLTAIELASRPRAEVLADHIRARASSESTNPLREGTADQGTRFKSARSLAEVLGDLI